MSGAQTSTFPSENELLAPAYLNIQQQQQANRNQLMPYQLQEEQQKVGSADMAVVGQAALGLLTNYTDEASRAAAFPGVVKALQDAGYARNAPSQYPGEAALRQLSGMAISPEKQYELGIIVPPGLAKALGGGQQQTGAPGGGGGGSHWSSQLTGDIEHDRPIIVAHESGGNPTVLNYVAQADPSAYERGATASGKYQFVNSTWREGMQLAGIDPAQYPTARSAPEAVQDKVFNAVYAKHGTAPWDPSKWGSAWVPTPSGRFILARGAPGATPPAAPGATQTATATPQVQAGGAPPAPPGAAPGAAAAPTVSMGDAITAAGNSPALQPPIGQQATPPRTVTQPPTKTSAADAIVGGIQQAQASPLVRGTGLEAGPSSAVATVAEAPWAATPGAGATSYSDSPTIPQAPPNALAPGGAKGPPAPAQPPAAPQAQTAAPVQIPGTGINSPQYQQFQAIQRQIDQLMPYAALPAAKAKIAQLQAQQSVLMQMDSVVTLPDGRQVHTLTGKVDNAATPLAHYVFDPNAGGQGVPGFVDTTGTHEPKVSPARRLVQRPDGTVIDDTGRIVSPADLPGAQAAAAAKAAGTATGTAVAKQLPALIDQGRGAAQAIGNIDYGLGQIEKAKQGGIPTGYFAPWAATLGAIGKSIGGDVGERIATLGADPSAIGNIQTAGKTLAVVSGAILEQILGPGSQITDAKIQHFIHAQPGIETDPEALNRVLNWARSQFVYEQEMAKAGVTEAAKSPTGTLPLNWQAQYFRDKGFAPIYNPTTGEMEQPEGRSPTREPPATLATAPVNPAARTVGTTYNTPKGPLKWTGTVWAQP